MRRLFYQSAVLFFVGAAWLGSSDSLTGPRAGTPPYPFAPGPGRFQADIRSYESLFPGQRPGETLHGIGFRRVYLEDGSRPFRDQKSRPIRISIWYPVAPASGPLLRLGDYVSLHQDQDTLNGIPAFNEWAKMMKTEESRVESILALVNKARLDPTPASGRFPLVVYASSFRGPAYENFAMFEYLAARGFVIVSIPSVGKDATGMTMDKRGVESQLRDLELAYDLALALPSVDRERVGTMGFSLGAVPAALLAFRDGVRACVNIDGGMCYTYSLLGDTLDDSEAKLRAAYLQLTQRPVPSMPLDNNFYEFHAAAGAYHLQWKNMDHYDFGSMTLLLRSSRPKSYEPSAREIQLQGTNDTPYPERFQNYRHTVRIIYLFLDAFLRDSQESKRELDAFIKSVKPEHSDTFSIRAMK